MAASSPPAGSMENHQVTIVSACDKNFLWGAFLLAASVARYLPKTRLLILQTGFSGQDAAFLNQFPNVQVAELSDGDPRNVANRKAEAILAADTEFVAWLDADCMIIGDVQEMLIPLNGEFQIRLREPWENAWVWRNQYAPGEPRGAVPAATLKQWQADVGEREKPLVTTTCVTNAFILHRKHLGFIRQWKEQIAKVIPPVHAGVVDMTNPAYFMTDESVLSSLLAFSNISPPVSETQFNKDPKAHIAHFGANPKPWKRWRPGVWYCNHHVLSLLDWVRESKRQIPPLPWSLKRQNRLPAYLMAQSEGLWAKSRSIVGKLLRGGR